jgi:hypothetical protein
VFISNAVFPVDSAISCKITTSFYIHKFENILHRKRRANLLLLVLTEVRVVVSALRHVSYIYMLRERGKML